MHVLDRFRVVSEDTEIVNGVAVYGVTVHFFMVVEHAVSPEGTGADNMAVREDVATESKSTIPFFSLQTRAKGVRIPSF